MFGDSHGVSQFAPVKGFDRAFVPRIAAQDIDRLSCAHQKPQCRFEIKSGDPRVTFDLRFPLFDECGRQVNYAARLRHLALEEERSRLRSGRRDLNTAAAAGIRPSGLLSVELSQITTCNPEDSRLGEEVRRNDDDDDDDDDDDHSVEAVRCAGRDTDVSYYRPTPFVHAPLAEEGETTGSMMDVSAATMPPCMSGQSSRFSIRSDAAVARPTPNRKSNTGGASTKRLSDVLGVSSSEIIAGAGDGHRGRSVIVSPRSTGAGVQPSLALSLNTTASSAPRHSRSTLNHRFPAEISRLTLGGSGDARGSVFRPTKELFGRSTCVAAASFDPRYKLLRTAASASTIDLNDAVLADAVSANFADAARGPSVNFTEHFVEDDAPGAIRCGDVLRYTEHGAATASLRISVAFGSGVFGATTTDGPCILYSSTLREAERAAVGLACLGAMAEVRCLRFNSGVTFTVIYCPSEAVPLSALNDSNGALPGTTFVVLSRVLRPLTASLAVHGNLFGENIFISIEAGTCVVIPIRWDDFADFRMFADVRIGRHIPLRCAATSDDDAGPGQLLRVGHDVECFLQEQLQNAAQRAVPLDAPCVSALQKSIGVATAARPMQANITIQLNCAMTAVDRCSDRDIFIRALESAYHRFYS